MTRKKSPNLVTLVGNDNYTYRQKGGKIDRKEFTNISIFRRMELAKLPIH